MWGIIKGVLILAAMWAVIFKVSDIVENLPWVYRRRLNARFRAAQNWPPKRPPEMTVGDYRVIYSDGAIQPTRFLPSEISGWAARCNRDSEDQGHPYRVVRIDDAAGNVVWPVA